MVIRASSKVVGGGGTPPFFDEAKKATDYTAGKYYLPSINFGLAASLNMSQDVLKYVPFVPFATHTFTAIGLYNGNPGDNGEKFRLGIYNDDGNGSPGTLLDDSGEVTLDAATALREIVISEELSAGVIYWLAMVNDSLTSFLAASRDGTVNELKSPFLTRFGFDSYRIAPGGPHRYLSESHVYGALPASATPDSFTSTMPVIVLKG